jgi:pyruvate dehydrogenase E2 component (dihydrolipoamide acetyltransferase)
MAEPILMLALSPTMEKGAIATWHKHEGDTVAAGDILCDVETDKATMEYECAASGTLRKIVVPAGAQAAVGDLIAIVGKPGEDISALLDKAPVKPAPAAADIGPIRPIGPIALEPPVAAVPPARVKASPLARKLAEQAGIALSAVHGSGPGGRIVRADIESAQTRPTSPTSLTSSRVLPAPPLAAADQTIPVSQKRRIIAQRLAESICSAPHFYLKLRVRADGLLAARTQLNAARTDKLSLNAFLIKFCAEALRRHPMVNASWQGDTIRAFGSVDIGLAVALPDGLLTPIVRNCAAKGIAQIDAELKTLIDKARANKLAPEEFTGATFTISNLGAAGIDEFTAIINPPGAAILAVGACTREAVPDAAGALNVATVMRLTLSCDHRVIDGMLGATFLKTLKELIEYPVLALL